MFRLRLFGRAHAHWLEAISILGARLNRWKIIPRRDHRVRPDEHRVGINGRAHCQFHALTTQDFGHSRLIRLAQIRAGKGLVRDQKQRTPYLPPGFMENQCKTRG